VYPESRISHGHSGCVLHSFMTRLTSSAQKAHLSVKTRPMSRAVAQKPSAGTGSSLRTTSALRMPLPGSVLLFGNFVQEPIHREMIRFNMNADDLGPEIGVGYEFASFPALRLHSRVARSHTLG
jgi:hypothetical protein